MFASIHGQGLTDSEAYTFGTVTTTMTLLTEQFGCVLATIRAVQQLVAHCCKTVDWAQVFGF